MTGQCKLEITQVPAAIANNIPSDPITVKLFDGATPRVLVTGTGTIGAGSVTLSAVEGSQCTLNPPSTSSPSALFPVTFSGVVFSTTATGSGCTLNAAWSDADVLPGQSTVIPVAAVVSNGALACEDVPTTLPTSFNATPGGATDPETTGFFAGSRAAPWKSTACNPIKWVATNNIGGSGEVYDLNGFKLPVNAASLVYEGDTSNGVLLAHTITFAIEPADTNGLPDPTRQTRYCDTGPLNTGKDCTVKAEFGGFLKIAQACSSTTVNITSIPSGEPGCQRGSAWVPIACGSVSSPSSKCVQFSVDFLEFRDPPWGRTR